MQTVLEQGSIDKPLTFDGGLIQLSFIPVCSLNTCNISVKLCRGFALQCFSLLGQTNLICCFSSAPASTSNTPLQLSLLPFASDTPPINAINNNVMSRETSLMASAHGHLNNEVMNNNRPPAPKFRKWLMRNNKSSLSGLIETEYNCTMLAENPEIMGL